MPARTVDDRQTELVLLYAIKEAAARFVKDDPRMTKATLANAVQVFLSWEARQGGDRRFGPR